MERDRSWTSEDLGKRDFVNLTPAFIGVCFKTIMLLVEEKEGKPPLAFRQSM